MSKTLFEKLIAREIPADIVFEDDLVIAFRDIKPQAPTHVLIILKKPIPRIADARPEDEQVLGHLFVVAKQIAREQGIAESGYRLIVNCRDDGGQEVYHLHMHLVGGRNLGPLLAKTSD